MLESFDGKKIQVYLWDDVEAPKGVVQICHGMSEHCGRYETFAKFLNAHGYIVFGDDHRAFGRTDNNSGYCDGDICGDTMKDLLFFHDHLRTKYPGLPTVFFGHSYGSMLAQRFVQHDTGISACLMSGVGGAPHAVAAVGSALFAPFAKASPKKAMGGSNDGMNKKFSDTDIPHAWLTRDKDVRAQYESDPLCGGTTSLSFMHSMMKLVRDYTDPKNIAKIRKDLPIGIFCGSEDSVGNFGKNPTALYETYRKNGIQASLKLYPGARHEVLNELNKEEVYQDMLDFIVSALGK